MHTVVHEEAVKPLAGWLVVVRSGSMQPYQDIPVYEGNNILGRDERCGPQCVRDPLASAQHAQIQAQAGQAIIIDLGAKNQTVVNNEKVRTAVLEHGDRVRVGRTTMVYVPLPQPQGRVR